MLLFLFGPCQLIMPAWCSIGQPWWLAAPGAVAAANAVSCHAGFVPVQAAGQEGREAGASCFSLSPSVVITSQEMNWQQAGEKQLATAIKGKLRLSRKEKREVNWVAIKESMGRKCPIVAGECAAPCFTQEATLIRHTSTRLFRLREF